MLNSQGAGFVCSCPSPLSFVVQRKPHPGCPLTAGSSLWNVEEREKLFLSLLLIGPLAVMQELHRWCSMVVHVPAFLRGSMFRKHQQEAHRSLSRTVIMGSQLHLFSSFSFTQNRDNGWLPVVINLWITLHFPFSFFFSLSISLSSRLSKPLITNSQY